MSYKFKYAKNTIDLVVGITYGISAMFHFSFLVIILVNFKKINLFIPLLLFVSISYIALFILYLNIYFGRRNYLVINDDKLFKDQGLIRSNKKVELSNIRYVRKIGDKIRIGLEERNELRINLNCLNVEDITKLESILGSNMQ
ncbi:MAG: hypothetical protein N4A62_15565 [Marinisporobacter sp.]|jgi:hypothetical protein|nr:hypothetical protein [Marinisporobacter sp.]